MDSDLRQKLEEFRKLGLSRRDVIATRSRRSLYYFTKTFWGIANKGVPFQPGWHIEMLCEHLEAVSKGDIIKLLINTVYRHSKPVWEGLRVTLADGSRKTVGEVLVGDHILDHTGKMNRVDQVHIQGDQDCLDIETFTGRILTVAKDHPVLTTRGWVEAQHLHYRDSLGLVAPTVEFGTPTNAEGYFVRDGSCYLQADPIKEIREVGNYPCRCFTMRDAPSFVVEDLAVHNSSIVSVFWPVWEWLQDSEASDGQMGPHTRFLCMSYAAHLSQRDARASRDIITSDLFRELFGDYLKLSEDQNTKANYENNFGGRRLSSSIEGVGTGEGGDRLICLPYESLITTDHGELPIGQIVEERLPVLILGPSGWNEIEAYEKNPGRELLEFILEGGASFACTDEHPVWIEHDGQEGFLPAKDVTKLHGKVYLRRLCQGVQQGSRSRSQEQDGVVLFEDVLWDFRERRAESRLGWGYDEPNLSQLSTDILRKALRSPSENYVLADLLGSTVQFQSWANMRELQKSLHPKNQDERAQVLWPEMRLSGPSNGNQGAGQRPVCERDLGRETYSWLHSQTQEAYQNPGRFLLHYLRKAQAGQVAGPSYRRHTVEPCPQQSGNGMHFLPQETSPGRQSSRFEPPATERVGLVDIIRHPAPPAVYNLRVTPDHSYFAERSLVHNCDDPHHAQEVFFPAQRQAVIDWWVRVMTTRENKPKTSRVVAAQRLHPKDLSGYILANEKGWDLVIVGIRHNPDRVYSTVLGKTDRREVNGELLWSNRYMNDPDDGAVRQPDGTWKGEVFRYDDVWEQGHRNALRENAPAQLDQDPASGGFALMEESYFPLYSEVPATDMFWFWSWDMNFKNAPTADFVAGLYIGYYHPLRRYYVVNRRMGQLEYKDAKVMVRESYRSTPDCSAVVVEESANGFAIISDLGSEGVPIQPYKVGATSKLSRQRTLSGIAAERRIWMPSWAPWVYGSIPGESQGLVTELCGLPNTTNDDQSDSLVNAVLWNERKLVDGTDETPKEIMLGRVW